MPARVGGTAIILFVVASSLLQSMLEVSSPALLTYISSQLWTVVIVSSCLVTAVQALGCLATYFVFLWDSSLPQPSPHTDDYVYYVKATTKTLEVLLALVLVSEGFYDSVFAEQEWNLLNNIVLGVHCYFNIYMRVSQGWACYLQRRETSARISELPTASRQELEALGDVCSICYQDMLTLGKDDDETGCVMTQCGHIFHRHCLRRWLVVQDNCPLCTHPVVKQEELAESEVDTEDERLPPENLASNDDPDERN